MALGRFFSRPVTGYSIRRMRQGDVVVAYQAKDFEFVELQNSHKLIAYAAGRMRRYRIRITPGDRIRVELSPYDLNRGRVVYRYRD